ncbi:MAG TPA: DUF4440 domain-containing protein [Bryobacteraceae bacterium]|nr:DUF4440 domain-containing protein [Bryobacteraceae bacterium]
MRREMNAAACACLAMLLLTSACSRQATADTRAAEESTIRSLDEQWSKTAAANDLEGTVSYYGDDATLLPANAPAITGKPAIHAFWGSMLGPSSSISWQANKVEVSRSGDLAYLTGAYVATGKDSQGHTVTEHGKEVEVWKKQPDGRWKVEADIWNSNEPPAVPDKQ